MPEVGSKVAKFANPKHEIEAQLTQSPSPIGPSNI